MILQVSLHQVQRAITALELCLVLSLPIVGQTEINLDKTGHRNGWLMAVLFEELPFEHAGLGQTLGGP